MTFFFLMDCGRQNNGSSTSYRQNRECITLHGKETDFAKVIKLRILRWRDSSGLLGVITKILTRGRQSLCTSKLVYIFLSREWKGNPKKGEKTSADQMSDKELISRMYVKKKLLQFNKKNNNPIEKWAKGLSRHLSKEDTSMSNKQECSTSLVIREIKTTIRNHFTPSRLTIIRKTIINVVKDVKKLEPR